MKVFAIGVLMAALLAVGAARADTVTYELDLVVTSFTGPDPFGYTSAPSTAGTFDVSYDPSVYLQNPTSYPIGTYVISGQLGNIPYPQGSCSTGLATGQPCGISLDTSANLLGIFQLYSGPVMPYQCSPVTFTCRLTGLSMAKDGTWSASDFSDNNGPSFGSLSGTYTIALVNPVPLPPALSLFACGLLGISFAARRRTGWSSYLQPGIVSEPNRSEVR
jgi:hypothetical protein